MEGCKPCRTPLPSTMKLTGIGGASFADPRLYHSVVGSLQYITITRPELAYNVSKVSQYMQNLLKVHWLVVKRILRYLAGTLTSGLLLDKDPSLEIFAYCDLDWGGDLDDRKSQGGYFIFLGKNLVS
ncbi:uncharacterized protein LOC110265078 [Arachis ipaensis]|uniref:uncharacterized protein LOC110265078 n=1 Tax=Arachis ipaensis TaxID=130454 RepID=UPI000A2B5D59|nr:uncharacterized protein LOC110265078 [Arachis ipaensis]